MFVSKEIRCIVSFDEQSVEIDKQKTPKNNDKISNAKSCILGFI
jgi:hypothetical protein